MPDEAVSLRDINWRETFPFTHLFRAFRVAVHPSKLILALVALGFLWCGGLILDTLWSREYQVAPIELETLGLRESSDPFLRSIGQQIPMRDVRLEARAQRRDGAPVYGIFDTLFTLEVYNANNVLMHRADPFESVWQFVAVVPMWLWSNHWLFALIYTAYFLRWNRVLKEVRHDPDRASYTDIAITPANEGEFETLDLYHATAGGEAALARKRRDEAIRAKVAAAE